MGVFLDSGFPVAAFNRRSSNQGIGVVEVQAVCEGVYIAGLLGFPSFSVVSDSKDKGQIVGEVLVYTNPGMHFGDIHVLKATYVKELENIVGNAKFAIFFPTKGPRSLADEMANSDFDGDMYWVSRNPELLKYYKPSKPWEKIYPTSSASLPTPAHFSSDKLEHELFQQFITARFHRSNIIGTASDSWLAFMDRLLTLGDDCAEEKNCLKEKMLQLTDIYYDALDAPKSGKKMHPKVEKRLVVFTYSVVALAYFV
ncbi:hypothetical protein GIB67_023250 [Kingdonia uniflora]|uniref:RNA-dependent RNA polymerase n=1 Tax=Kingdonia uniflora TaxID=39325 RepID=A0A7J7LJR3_9MAGN|nr:hypothetical protein GIB67_023250 [Kingdonia uniflora]